MSKDFKKPKFRSPSYPAIDLPKAIKRAEELHIVAQHHAVPRHVLASAWGYKIKSSGLSATAAALDKFGLMEASGSGDQRRYRLSDRAVRILKDPDLTSSKRRLAIKDAAIQPKVFHNIWEKFGMPGVNGQAETAVMSYLTLDLKDQGEAYFSESAARDALDSFQSSLRFADFGMEDIYGVGDTAEVDVAPSSHISEGDWVQWTADGVERFASPQKVRATMQSDDGKNWVFVEGSETGIPLGEVEVIAEGKQSDITPPSLPLMSDASKVQILTQGLHTPELSGADIGTDLFVEKTQLDEGIVSLQMPAVMSLESLQDFEDWLELIIRKAKRRAKPGASSEP